MLGVLFSGAVALFTGYTAWALWKDRQERLQIHGTYDLNIALLDKENDWTPAPVDPHGLDSITVSVTVTNKSAQSLRVIEWSFHGIPLYGPNDLGIEKSIAPGQSGSFSLTVFPDWVSWASEVEHGPSRPSWRASVIIDRRTLIYATKSLDAKLTTTAATIMDSASKIKTHS